MKSSEKIYAAQISIFMIVIIGGLFLPPSAWEWMFYNQGLLLLFVGVPAVVLGIWSTAIADRLRRDGK